MIANLSKVDELNLAPVAESPRWLATGIQGAWVPLCQRSALSSSKPT